MPINFEVMKKSSSVLSFLSLKPISSVTLTFYESRLAQEFQSEIFYIQENFLFGTTTSCFCQLQGLLSLGFLTPESSSRTGEDINQVTSQKKAEYPKPDTELEFSYHNPWQQLGKAM